jgi:hypothetical protein
LLNSDKLNGHFDTLPFFDLIFAVELAKVAAQTSIFQKQGAAAPPTKNE